MRCYLIAASLESALDEYTNNWTLVKLIERFSPQEYPAHLPLFIHYFFEADDEEIGQTFEMQGVLVDSEGEIVSGSDPFEFPMENRRHRIRSKGLVVPEDGQHYIQCRLREAGDEEWQMVEAFWPLSGDPVEG